MGAVSLEVDLDEDLQAVEKLGVSQQLVITIQTYRNLQKVLSSINDWSKKMSTQIDDLTAQVTANTTVIESAITLIQGFSKRLDDGITAAEAGDLSKLNDLKAELASEDQKLAKAVADNTPAAPLPPADASTVTASDTLVAGSGSDTTASAAASAAPAA